METQVKNKKTVKVGGANKGDFMANIRLHPLPPKGFDARKATPATLKTFGIPQRPDPKLFPKLTERWDKIFSKEIEFITPEFKPMEELIPGIKRTHGPIKEVANSNTSIWSGSVVQTPASDPFKSISGLFNVADVASPNGAAGSLYMVSWIGIDGYGGNDVCQIGTVQSITTAGNGSVSKNVYAWTEWFPASWVGISNFQVNFGDSISALLCINSPTQAGFNMFNETTLQHTGFTFNAPAGTTLTGNTAEWIVERPGIGGGTASLPSYGDVYFDGIASTKSNKAFDAGNGLLLNMVEGTTTVSVATSENATLVRVNSSF